jgi:hypothetical protein
MSKITILNAEKNMKVTQGSIVQSVEHGTVYLITNLGLVDLEFGSATPIMDHHVIQFVEQEIRTGNLVLVGKGTLVVLEQE